MTDIVRCPGCGGMIDRDQYLRCPDCHEDLVAALTASLVEPVEAAPESARNVDVWHCTSPGCHDNPALDQTVEACPYCFEPRPSSAKPEQAEDRFELRDESSAVVIPLSGPGPWRLGREESDSPQLGGFMTVSRTHALLARNPNGLTIRDLGSSNRTLIGKVALEPDEERLLDPGAIIGLGRTVRLRLHLR